MRLVSACSLLLLGAAACAGAEKKPAASSEPQKVAVASATLVPKSVAATQSTTSGSATFTSGSGKLTLTLAIQGASPGEHGVHFHETGDCSADDAASAGGHWNPGKHPHGSATDPSSTHLGDLGNLTVGPDGTGTLVVANSGWSVGDGAEGDVLGKAIIVHAQVDDLSTQADPDAGVTPGNSGKRVACGVIERAATP